MSQVVKATLAAMAQLVEIQHADWASSSFEIASAATEPLPCGFRLVQTPGLGLQANACFTDNITVELYDLKGTLLVQRALYIPAGGFIELPTAHLPSGAYALKIRHASGIYAQKVLIP
jgi:hypothetical protein